MPSDDTQFKPGTPKPPTSGRRKGTPNKQSIALYDKLAQAVETYLPYLPSDIDNMRRYAISRATITTMTRLLSLTLAHAERFGEDVERTPFEPPPVDPDSPRYKLATEHRQIMMFLRDQDRRDQAADTFSA